jgi:hypothetical protein
MAFLSGKVPSATVATSHMEGSDRRAEMCALSIKFGNENLNGVHLFFND